MTAALTARQLLQQPEPVTQGRLQLANTDYEILASLRHLAGRRSTLQVRRVADEQLRVIKLFIAQGKGQQEFERELSAHDHCRSHNIAVADICQQLNAEQGISAIAYQYLPNARTVAQLDVVEQPITALFELFARCHQADCYQQDPHLDNFAWSDGTLYLLDLASVVIADKALPMDTCLKNLARLLVQWPAERQTELMAKLPAYFTIRQQVFTDSLKQKISALYDQARRQHQRHYLKKQLRNCTMTGYRLTPWQQAAWRKGAIEPLQIEQLESAMQTGQPLKLGNSATVMLCQLAGQPRVIKRYNMKTFGHWLRRCWRPSRAQVSWLNANLLEYAGIRTPAPLGFVEQRWLGLRHRAYFVCSHVEGRALLDLTDVELAEPDLLAQLKELFSKLRQHRLVHGDMKANNLLVDANGQLWLIDLDALRQMPANTFARLHQIDQHRFLQNWQGRDIEHQLKTVIEAA
ncbi:MAG: hypothetical protein JJU48_03935 [Methylophaga sp.]|nr:hypothetical protein [Methylophaga sp.]